MTSPEGLEDRGSALWTAFLEQHPGMSDPEREVALEACRAADLLERLERIIRVSDPVIENERGQLVAHPAIVEARQQRNVFKQLIATLRLPDDKTGKRPQQRGPRGAYKTGGASVMAMDKFRAVSGG